MTHDIAPAIRTAYDERYSDIEHIETIGEDTRFHRGFGTTGTRVELVDASAIGGCPRCGEDEMVLSRDLHPDEYDSAVFYCTNLTCPHFVADEVEYDMDKIRASTPERWDNTAKCPECETRFTTELVRGIHERHEYQDGGNSGIVTDVLCDECESLRFSESSSSDDSDDCTPNDLSEVEA